GIFLWNLQTIVKAFDELLPEVATKFDAGKEVFNTPNEQEFIDQMYPSCPNISIDYGIMEKASDVYVLCSDFGWTDLGTWGSLYEMSPKDENENVTLKCKTVYYESEDNIVVLPSEKLAVIQDLKGYIVAESDNVLLICKRENEQKIRQYVNDINVQFEGKYS
ncbi:MAG: mannose-1-phosphate guanylyltransferase, partial [Paludibacter sp.]